jgi:hypothetical protein
MSLVQSQERGAARLPARDRSRSKTGRRSDHRGDVSARAALKLPKRLDVARAAERWSAQLPALIEQQLRLE